MALPVVIGAVSAAFELAKLFPPIGRWLEGNKTAEVAGEMIKHAMDVTGEQSPDTAVAALINNPELMHAYQVRLLEHKETLDRLAFEREKLYVGDTQDARHAHAGNKGVFYLGVAILITFALIMVAVLVGSVLILTGGIVIKDVAVVAAVTGMIGTVVGYVASNAQQVVGYHFGSSSGSKENRVALSEAIKQIGGLQP